MMRPPGKLPEPTAHGGEPDRGVRAGFRPAPFLAVGAARRRWCALGSGGYLLLAAAAWSSAVPGQRSTQWRGKCTVGLGGAAMDGKSPPCGATSVGLAAHRCGVHVRRARRGHHVRRDRDHGGRTDNSHCSGCATACLGAYAPSDVGRPVDGYALDGPCLPDRLRTARDRRGELGPQLWMTTVTGMPGAVVSDGQTCG